MGGAELVWRGAYLNSVQSYYQAEDIAARGARTTSGYETISVVRADALEHVETICDKREGAHSIT